MVLFLIFITFFIISIIFCYYNIKTTSIQNQLIENFENELHMNLSEDDKKLYYSIIDTYELLLERDPSEDELNYDFDQIKTNKITLVDLFNKLKNTMEYKRINDIQFNSAIAPTDAHNDVQDYQLVGNLLKEIMPLNDVDYDPLHIDFLVLKYRSVDKDKNKFIKYIKKTPEYKDYKELVGDKPKIKIETVKDDNQFKIPKKTKVRLLDQEFELSRPELGKATSKMVKKGEDLVDKLKGKREDDIPEYKKGCMFYRQYKELQSSKQLADYQRKRNLEELEYHCNLDEYSNVDENNVLLEDQKWSVPQKHPPVCTNQNCNVNDSLTQTNLIGTLLDDVANNGKILPSFKYEEVDE